MEPAASAIASYVGSAGTCPPTTAATPMDTAGVDTAGGNYYCGNYYCGNIKGDGIFFHAGDGGTGGYLLNVGMRSIPDGTSNTLMVGEKTMPRTRTYNSTTCVEGSKDYYQWLGGWTDVASMTHGINYPCRTSWSTGNQYGSFHVGGAQFLLCDGAVRFISENTSFVVLRAVATRTAGDTVGEF